MKFWVPFLLLLALTGPQTGQARPLVAASNYPLAFLLERLGGSDYQSLQLLPEGTDPHAYNPGLGDLTRAVKARLLVYNSAPLEPWAERLAAEVERNGGQTLKLIDRFGAGNQYHQPEHDAHDETEHHGFDPHLWLDPMLYLEVAEWIAAELVELDRGAQKRIENRLDRLGAELKALDQEYRETLKGCRGRTLIASHDAWGYLAERYGLETFALHELSAQSQTSLKQMVDAVNQARTSGANAVFYETLTDARLSRTLALETGLELLELHPLGNRGSVDAKGGQDYFDLMRRNLKNLSRGLGCSR